MKRIKMIFKEANLSLYLKPCDIFVTSSSSAMIEFIPDTISLDSLKKMFPKDTGKAWTLRTFFERYFISNFEGA